MIATLRKANPIEQAAATHAFLSALIAQGEAGTDDAHRLHELPASVDQRVWGAIVAGLLATGIICRVGDQQSVTPHDADTHSDGLPILRGRLTKRVRMRPTEAYLQLFCPVHGSHTHGWDLSDDPARIEHRVSHCRELHPDGYYIGLDYNAEHAVSIPGGR